jgi:hypothetical protein
LKNRNTVLVVDERMLKCIQRLLQQHAYGPIMFSSAQAFKSHTCNPLLIMPRYFFDVRDGEGFVKDDEGLELLDIAEAQIEAAESPLLASANPAVLALTAVSPATGRFLERIRRTCCSPLSWLCLVPT